MTTEPKTYRGRGFALLEPEARRAVASKGGKMAHLNRTAFQFDSESGREAGRLGGKRRAENMAKAKNFPPPDKLTSALLPMPPEVDDEDHVFVTDEDSYDAT